MTPISYKFYKGHKTVIKQNHKFYFIEYLQIKI